MFYYINTHIPRSSISSWYALINFITQNRSMQELLAAKEELYDQGKEGIFEENKMKQWAVDDSQQYCWYGPPIAH